MPTRRERGRPNVGACAVKVNPDELATVLQVACLTEDRTGDEQRAMLHLALKVDMDRAAFRWQSNPQVPKMVWEVEQSYSPSSGRRVGLRAPEREQLARLHAKFVPCAACGVRQGDHAVQCLSADLERHRAAHGPQEGRLV